MSEKFHKRVSVEEVEEGSTLSPKFDKNGLIPCVTTDSETHEVLMLGYMNAEALIKTLEEGEAYYFSRSRQKVWHKGATSGLIQAVKEIRIDDDQDSIWLSVEVGGSGASCHVGYKSCFYRSIPIKNKVSKNIELKWEEDKKLFDPIEVYGDAPNPTKL
ncbi:MAG: phosphoribosyl-AMP cyclohydrolase [Hyphomicrobiales bacterium]|nr:phosphoribosyl-AMP cyclohydrolase [Hyphomicrobiales bacterium]MDG1665360.1 phosphoribosyl-AMP cyclohydrolase [Hyphomicrobiales bacterium]